MNIVGPWENDKYYFIRRFFKCHDDKTACWIAKTTVTSVHEWRIKLIVQKEYKYCVWSDMKFEKTIEMAKRAVDEFAISLGYRLIDDRLAVLL